MTDPLVTKADAPAYTDLHGLSRLKRAAGDNDPAAIRKVAEQFESMFTRMMLKSMRDASGPDPMFGSDQQQMYQSMADDQLSIQLSKGKGLGLADMLMKQLAKMGVKGAGGSAAGTPSATSTTAASSPGSARKADQAAMGSTGPGIGSAKAAAAAYSSTATTSTAASDATRSGFVQDLWPQAQEAGQLLGVDPRHLIAQAALETNWGRSMPTDANGQCSNNLFGIKASGDWSGDTVTNITQEVHNGVSTSTSAPFRAYASPAQSMQDYVAMLRNNPRYAAALNTGSDVQAFAAGLQRGGYATDPDYAHKIAAVASSVALKVGDAVPISGKTGAL